MAGALVWSSDEFGLGVNAVSEKREDVTTICEVVVHLRQVAGLRLKMRVEGQDDTQDQEILVGVGAMTPGVTSAPRKKPPPGPRESSMRTTLEYRVPFRQVTAIVRLEHRISRLLVRR